MGDVAGSCLMSESGDFDVVLLTPHFSIKIFINKPWRESPISKL